MEINLTNPGVLSALCFLVVAICVVIALNRHDRKKDDLK